MPNNPFLSSAGQERRSQILQLALTEAKLRRRRRWIVPWAASLGILCAVALPLMQHRNPPMPAPTAGPQPIRIAAEIPVLPASQPTSAIEYLATDPTVTDRLSIKPGPKSWQTIGDDELLSELAAAGQPMGLAYIGGRAILLPAGAADHSAR
jgi:hypothetical protein